LKTCCSSYLFHFSKKSHGLPILYYISHSQKKYPGLEYLLHATVHGLGWRQPFFRAAKSLPRICSYNLFMTPFLTAIFTPVRCIESNSVMLCISASVTAGSVRVVLISVCKGQNCSVMYKALGGDRNIDFKILEENFWKYKWRRKKMEWKMSNNNL